MLKMSESCDVIHKWDIYTIPSKAQGTFLRTESTYESEGRVKGYEMSPARPHTVIANVYL